MAITLSYSITDTQNDVWQIIYIYKDCNSVWGSLSLEPRLSVPDFILQFWRKIRKKAWKDFSCDKVAPWHRIYQMWRQYVTWNVQVIVYSKMSRGKKMQQGDWVTWHVGLLLTKSSCISWLDILVVRALLKYWNQCMGAMKMPYHI